MPNDPPSQLPSMRQLQIPLCAREDCRNWGVILKAWSASACSMMALSSFSCIRSIPRITSSTGLIHDQCGRPEERRVRGAAWISGCWGKSLSTPSRSRTSQFVCAYACPVCRTISLCRKLCASCVSTVSTPKSVVCERTQPFQPRNDADRIRAPRLSTGRCLGSETPRPHGTGLGLLTIFDLPPPSSASAPPSPPPQQRAWCRPRP
jgi:hypothetical protein